MSGSSQTQQQTSHVSPWGPQAKGIKFAFKQAMNAYEDAQGANKPTDFIAGMTPEQMATFNQMIGFANSAAPGVDAQANRANGMMHRGSNSMFGALRGLQNFDPSKLYNNEAILKSANAFADNPAVSGMVEAAMRDATNQVRDVGMPGISANAAATGNINSSRTGLAEGVLMRDLAARTADVSSNLRGSLFQSGIEQGANMAQSNNSSILNALNSRGALGQAAFGAGNTSFNDAISNRGNLFALANLGGAGLQQGHQLKLDNDAAKYNFGTSSPFDALRQYMSILGGNNWGSQGTSTSTTSNQLSPWQIFGGLLGAGGSMGQGLGSLGWKPFG